LEGIADPGNYFDMTARVPVTISNPNFDWLL
jgi:hypothetical protein